MKQIAIYGKGGIGKSTISSNLSAALCKKGKKVLQIGCDPKHDSTRLLLKGKSVNTVLDYIRDTTPDKYRVEEIIFKGYNGVECVEAGGPNPGVGCAGRGILTTFNLLESFNIKNRGYDLVLYDVLGDVVCGGFAVPLRREYADIVYIVTSGEFMSIYAANNILRGIKNYDNSLKRVGGLIFNKRGVEKEEERIRKFSHGVKIPIIETFPRSDEFTYSEKIGLPLVEFEDSKVSKKFLNLAENIINQKNLFEANPLTDEELESTILGGKVESFTYENQEEKIESNKESEEEIDYTKFLSKNVLKREPLHGCAFNGAVNMTIQLKDAITIAHGPRSCAHISYQTMTSIGRRAFFERGILMPLQINPPIVSSEMNEGVMVFGGIQELKEKIVKLKNMGKALFVVTTCPAGIIGEDVDIVKNLQEVDIPVIPIKTDGNITGDYLQGMIYAYIETAKALIDISVLKEDNLVNIIGEKTIAKNTEENFKTMEKFLNAMDIYVNCRFLCNTKVEDVKNFMKGKLNILAYEDYMGRMMKKFFIEEYKVEFFKNPFPVGFEETEKWILEIAKCFNKEHKVKSLVEHNKEIYTEEILKLKPLLKNKKLMIITYNHQIEWILQTAVDLEMDIVKLCILDFSQEMLFKTKFKDKFPIELKYDESKRVRDIKSLKPDILLTNYTSSSLQEEVLTDNIPLCPDVGFFSGLSLAKRWAGLLKLNLKEGWREDEKLFSKYYAR